MKNENYEVRETTETTNGNKNNNKNRTRKGSSPRNRRIDRYNDKRRCVDNDPSWYGKNPEVLRDAASLAFSNVTGNHVSLKFGNATTFAPQMMSVPGIMTLDYFPTYCTDQISNAYNTAMNVSGKNIYSFVRHANSGSSNYEWQDLIMAICAADQVFAAIGAGIRAYGTMMNFDQKNRYTPEALVTAMGFDYDSLAGNLADFRYQINQLISKASVIWVPNTMTLVNRHWWMNTSVYMDNESAKAQYYMYVPTAAYKFSERTSTSGSSLVPVQWPTKMTRADYSAFVNSLMEPLIQSEDLGIMFGDMLKAYGKEKIFTLSPIVEDTKVIPSYSQEVLTQIHNSMTVPVLTTQLPSIVQNANGTIEIPTYTLRNVANLNAWTNAITYLDFKGTQIPQPENIMVATRSHARLENVQAGATPTALLRAGTEALSSIHVYYFGSDGLASNGLQVIRQSSENISVTTSVSIFDWAPIVYIIDSSDTGNQLSGIIADIDNFTTLTAEALSKMHSTAVLSEFDVPISL